MNFVGKDATNDFEDVGHSETAIELMKKYCIGEVDSLTVPTKKTYLAAQLATGSKQNKNSDFVFKILQLLVPLLILGVAFAVRHFTKKE